MLAAEQIVLPAERLLSHCARFPLHFVVDGDAISVYVREKPTRLAD